MKKTDWANFLKFCINNWIKILEIQEIKKFEILNSWVVRQFKNEYNPIHIGTLDMYLVRVF